MKKIEKFICLTNKLIYLMSNMSRLRTKYIPFNPAHQLPASSSSEAEPLSSRTAGELEYAGILLVDNEFRSNGNSYQTIILGKNVVTDKYELFYGSTYSTIALSTQVAINGINEKSANMFRLKNTALNSTFSIKSFDNKRIVYLIRVQPPKFGIQTSVFNKNKFVLETNEAPVDWFQTTEITRIGIKEAISSGLLLHTDGDFEMFDVDGNPITIIEHDVKIIQEAVKNKMNVIAPIHQLKYIGYYSNKYDEGDKPYLNTTGCYMI